jgi:hypothetical protein
LHALIVDQHFGELSSEAAELLEAHLAQDAEARAEAYRIRQTLEVTSRAVLLNPELARVETSDSAETEFSASGRRIGAPWLAKAASIALLAALTSTAGYFVGKRQDTVPVATISPPTRESQVPRKDSPWARYRFASEQGGTHMQVVRVDPKNPDNSTLR